MILFVTFEKASRFMLTLFYVFFSNYATVAAQHQSNSLDKSIKRLDEDARRIGRISRKEIEEVLDEIRQSSKSNYFPLAVKIMVNLKCCFI